MYYHMSHSSTAVNKQSNNKPNTNKMAGSSGCVFTRDQMANAAAILRQLNSPDRLPVFMQYNGTMSGHHSYSSDYSCGSCNSTTAPTEFRSGGNYTPK